MSRTLARCNFDQIAEDAVRCGAGNFRLDPHNRSHYSSGDPSIAKGTAT